MFTNYSDYDFRNDQAIDMLEELFWETSYSSYNFYDYMTLNKEQSSNQTISAKELGLEKQFRVSNTGVDIAAKPLTTKALKDTSLTGNFYGNSIQLEEYPFNPNQIATQNFALYPLHNDFVDIDETFTTFKGLSSLISKFAVTPLGSSTPALSPRSYISVFNHFRSDYEDFN